MTFLSLLACFSERRRFRVGVFCGREERKQILSGLDLSCTNISSGRVGGGFGEVEGEMTKEEKRKKNLGGAQGELIPDLCCSFR